MLEPKEKVKYFWAKAGSAERQVATAIRIRVKYALAKLYQAWGRPVPRVLWEIRGVMRRAAQNYVPKVYPGRVTLFRASKRRREIYPDPTMGWGNLAAGGLEIHETLGHHGDIVVEPQVRFLIEKLKACLARAHTMESAERSDSGRDAGTSPIKVITASSFDSGTALADKSPE